MSRSRAFGDANGVRNAASPRRLNPRAPPPVPPCPRSRRWSTRWGENTAIGAVCDATTTTKKVRRWECCGLRHRRAESRFSGVFIIAVHRAFVLGLGTRHRGIVDLSEGVIRCVTVFACYSSLLLLFVTEVMRALVAGDVSYIETTVTQLRDQPQTAWAALFYSCAPRFDYWLRHMPPNE